MPELPEVEAARRLVERNCQAKKIKKVVVLDDDKVFEGISSEELRQALEGKTLLAVHRKGKYLWLQLDNEGPWPMLHFGMTGAIYIEGVGAAKYINTKLDTSGDWPPKFWRFHVEFEDGTKMAFTDARRFARVKLQVDPEACEPICKLGFDALLNLPPQTDFDELLKKRGKGNLRIKALLLDQEFAAGVGNWVADEVLYQAHIHPEHPVGMLSSEQLQRLRDALASVVNLACAVEADSQRFPPNWLFHFRWTGKKASAVDGHKIEFVTAGGRTSAYVPHFQKLPAGVSTNGVRKAGAGAKRKRKGAEEEDEAEEDDDDDDDGPGDKAPKRKRGAKPTAAAPAAAASKRKPAKAAAATPAAATPATVSKRKPAAAAAASAATSAAEAAASKRKPAKAAAGSAPKRTRKTGTEAAASADEPEEEAALQPPPPPLPRGRSNPAARSEPSTSSGAAGKRKATAAKATAQDEAVEEPLEEEAKPKGRARGKAGAAAGGLEQGEAKPKGKAAKSKAEEEQAEAGEKPKRKAARVKTEDAQTGGGEKPKGRGRAKATGGKAHEGDADVGAEGRRKPKGGAAAKAAEAVKEADGDEAAEGGGKPKGRAAVQAAEAVKQEADTGVAAEAGGTLATEGSVGEAAPVAPVAKGRAAEDVKQQAEAGLAAEGGGTLVAGEAAG